MDFRDLEYLDPALAERTRYELELLLLEEAAPPQTTWITPIAKSPTPIYGEPYQGRPALPAPPSTTEPNSSQNYLMWAGIVVAILIIGMGMTSLFSKPLASTPKAKPLPPDTTYSVVGGPSVTADFINQVLDHYGSPAAGQGQAMYDLGVKSGVDPVFALAFFMHESSFGKAGMATVTLGLGNERCINDRPCVNTQGLPCQTGQSCYAQFSSWADGFEHWYLLIKNGYVGGQVSRSCPCTTIPQIIPVYAPNADHNNEAGYIASVENAVATWRKGTVVIS
jgi:hypothetical protein